MAENMWIVAEIAASPCVRLATPVEDLHHFGLIAQQRRDLAIPFTDTKN